MNGTIAKYFKSPKEDSLPKASLGREEELKKDGEVNEASEVEEPEPGPSKPSKSDVDRLIAENMASVLKSLKKKRSHRCSKRKRNDEHREKGEAPADDDGSESSRHTSPQKSKDDKPSVDPPADLPAQDPPKEGSNKENKTVNAFQLMMASRNKAIGSNSPGRDTNSDAPDPIEAQKKDEKVKRKLKLEEWADRKGAGKRKLQEEAQEEYVEHQMNRRAKRLKKLIKNMEVEEEEEEVVAPEPPVLRESPRKSARKSKEPSQAVLLKVTAKRGRRRLSSADSRAPSETATPEQSPVKKSAEEEEFVTKLSSPLKKKDSLLGYFAKVGKSPSEPVPDVTTTTPTTPTVAENLPRRGRPRRQPAPPALPPEEDRDLVLNPIIVEELSEDIPEPPPTTTTTTPVTTVGSAGGRPRRSCAGKVKDYAVFGGTSPEKEVSTPTTSGKRTGKKPIVTPLKIINVGSPAAMQVVKSPSVSRRLSEDWGVEGTPRSSKSSVKLAPLFVKKAAEDPEKVRARQEFLRSGIPEKMRLEIEKQRCYEESILNESPVFPLVSHVQQLEGGAKEVDLGSCRVRVLSESPEKVGDDGDEEEEEDEFEFATLTSCDDDQVEGALAKLVDQGDHLFRNELPDIADVKSIVREWKQVYKHFPVFKCYKQFRAIFVEHCDEPLLPGRTREEALSEDSIELIEPKFSHANGELLFTEKYKPLKLDDILINCQPAITLKKFLSSWKEDRSHGNPYDSGDDFELSNSSSASSSAICNHIVLVGPPGCGKTSNVYAVANDMNFNVLELNASSRRKGKIILQELQEATQSHQVRRKEADSGVDIFKKAIARKRKPRKASTDSEPSSKKLSLILIEDADIVFDQDDGFVAAINQLISTSKRPIVLTTTDPHCTHLSRFISNNVIRYVAPGIAHVAKLLSILAIVEKVHIDQADLARLYALNRKDLRKTINELQFFIQSGGDRNLPQVPLPFNEPELHLRESSTTPTFTDHDETSNQSEPVTKNSSAPTRRHRSLFRLFSRNQNEPHQLIRAPLNLDNLWCNMERVLRTSPPPQVVPKRKKGKPAVAPVNSELDELVFFYENASVASLIQRDVKAVEDRLVDHLEEDIAHELVETSWERWFEGELNHAAATAKSKRRSGVGAMCYDSLKQFDDEGRQTISAYIGLGGPIRTRATYCDCEPLLRAICRTERERSRAERRGSRFYHYFRNYVAGGNGTMMVAPAPATSFSVDHFDELSTRFEEDLQRATVRTDVAAAGAESSDESR